MGGMQCATLLLPTVTVRPALPSYSHTHAHWRCAAVTSVRRKAVEEAAAPEAQKADGAAAEHKKRKRKRQQRLPKGWGHGGQLAPGLLREALLAVCRTVSNLPDLPACPCCRFDPANPGPPPDPQRWLPKWQRSDAKKLRKKMKGKVIPGEQAAPAAW